MSSNDFRICQLLLLLSSLLLLGACNGKNYRPVIDPKGADLSRYEADLVECQSIAAEQSVLAESAQGAVVGAAAGAVVGSIVGAIFGDAGEGAAAGAGWGGGQGAIDGAMNGLNGQSQIISNCVSGRGYSVLR